MKETIDKYRDIPFLSKGRDFDGVDCWGLVYLVYKQELDIDIPSWSDRYSNATKVDLDKKIVQYGDAFDHWRQVKNPKIFDVALFRTAKNFHVGLCIDERGREILHILEDGQVCIERVDSINWRNRLVGWYTWQN